MAFEVSSAPWSRLPCLVGQRTRLFKFERCARIHRPAQWTVPLL